MYKPTFCFEINTVSYFRGRRSAFLFLIIASFFAGCAISPEVAVRTEQMRSLSARKVIVLPSTAMRNSANASRLAELVSDELVLRGYKVEKSIDAAEVVIVASFSRTSSPISPADPSSSPALDLSRITPANFDTPGMTQSRFRGMESDLGIPKPTRQAGLIVTAISKADWLNATINSDRIVWRTIATMPQYEGQKDVLVTLVKAAGLQFP